MALFNRRGQDEDQTLESLTGDDYVTMVLLECCANKLCATVLSVARGTTCSARFSSFSADGITLQIIEAPDTPIQDATLVCVTFNRNTQAHVFLAPVIDRSHRASDSHYVTVEFPEQIAGVETRREFRIPVSYTFGLKARVNASGQWFDVCRVGDLSNSGIKLVFRPSSNPNLSVDSIVIVELELEGMKATIRGNVRRHHSDYYGVYFPNIGSGKGPTSDEFVMIVRRIEQMWLQHRCADVIE